MTSLCLPPLRRCGIVLIPSAHTRYAGLFERGGLAILTRFWRIVISAVSCQDLDTTSET